MFGVPAPSEPAPDIDSVPAEIVVIPEYVFAPDSDNVSEPIFVTVPVDVAMGSRTLIAPALVSNVNA